jgi:putative transposase
METNPTEQRLSFLIDYASGQWSMSELCERYRVSRPTGYKWLRRVEEEGESGFDERSRRPRSSPHQTPAAIEQQILETRAKYGWGAKKLLQVLRRRHPTLALPARSTVNAILDRHGKLYKQRRRRKWAHPGAAVLVTERPNEVWPVDFKGQFKTLDGVYCYPLTVSDHFSRRVLLCKALDSVKTKGAKPAFRRLFREVGLPGAIRSDNGAPFASTGIHGLCELNVWWMQLGIVHQRITPASPQENGAHERMHRELKHETTRPPAANLRGQQRKFDHFQARYNEERPHEALDGARPADRWEPSSRPYPERIALPQYPDHLEVRRVSTAGCFRLHHKQPFLTHALADQYVGLEAVGDGLWNIVYYRTLLGRIDERTGTITGV